MAEPNLPPAEKNPLNEEQEEEQRDEEQRDEEQRDKERRNSKKFHNLLYTKVTISSPIDLNVRRAKILQLPSLAWCHYEKMPKKMKLINSGHTVILSAKWFGERPFITGGPLKGKYVLSQVHFHWGKDALEGSEHSVERTRLPMELHAMHYNSQYLDQNDALQYDNGVICIVYFFTIKSKHSPVMHRIVSEFTSIKFAGSTTILEPFIITNLLYPFKGDYYLYWGSLETVNSTPKLMWLITREVSSLSVEQLRLFRFLLDSHERPIRKCFRDTNPKRSKYLFLVNPLTKFTNLTLSPVPRVQFYEPSAISTKCGGKFNDDDGESEEES